ncbi:MAG: hypothetical protein IJD78_03080 [Clostridia bacterium]|nr:hypothetical protein [Clostridia bacterium]MBQ3006524.1 hypothetical protein [Clostridia bacterium]
MKLKKAKKIILIILAVAWLSLYLLSNIVYQHDELYDYTAYNDTEYDYSRYNSQGIEDAWNLRERNRTNCYVENIRCCYIDEDTAYLVSTDREYVVLDIESGGFILYEGSENITDEEHLKTFKFISRMHIVRGILFGKYKSRTLI